MNTKGATKGGKRHLASGLEREERAEAKLRPGAEGLAERGRREKSGN